jgi:hypothetical protein
VNLRINAQALGSDQAFGTTKISRNLLPNAIAPAESFGAPKLNLQVIAQLVGSGGGFGSTTVFPGGVGLQPTGIAPGECFGSPTLEFTGNIFTNGITSGEEFGNVVISRMDVNGALALSDSSRFAIVVSETIPGAVVVGDRTRFLVTVSDAKRL